MSIDARIKQCQAHLPALLQRYLPVASSSTLAQAMHYGCLNGGKRLRPLLLYLSGEIFGCQSRDLDPLAAAIEFIHCYSLIHDDLPAMDNDELRRGKPTCHKVFGEATAILAGDALLTLAFDIMSTVEHFPTLAPSTLLQISKILAQAAGAKGMIHGQAMDLASEGQILPLEKLIQLHSAKTGALIAASVQCGALASGYASDFDLAKLQNYGEAIGLSFQIQDDLLDILGNSETMGKQPGQDVKNNKCTFVTLLGVEQAQAHAHTYHQQALHCLNEWDKPTQTLRDLADFIVARVN